MKTLTLPGTDLAVSALCLGSGASLSDRENKAEIFRLYDQFYEAGGRFIDTANVYGRWNADGENSSEQLIGEWMASRGCKKEMVIATKGGHPVLPEMKISRISPEEIEDDLDSSLFALGLERIDLFYLHRDNLSRPVEEIAQTLHRLQKKGKIRCYGVSNWTAARIEAFNAYAQAHGIDPIAASQPMWSLASVNADKLPDPTLVPMEDEMYFFHLRTGLPAVPYSSQAGGYFSKLDADPSAFGRLVLYEREENFKKLERVKEYSKAYGVSINQITLLYLLSQPFPVIPIVGCRTKDQLSDSLKALDLPLLSPDDLLYLGLSAE